ncbi:hypothetical protein [Methanothermobacter sp.]|uniref:hypothetical protein n=1 Tax=Methanothermobacter sp. TaxID=1884223 RepID=UPI00262FC401|nr:hypothetical protein [Methanothermobacter sp.]MDI9617518.1 hypothetical protein [Methanothermobacter sp.]
MSDAVETSRTPESVFGIIGAIFGLLGGLFAIVLSVFGSELLYLGVSAIPSSIVGIIGSVCKEQPQKGLCDPHSQCDLASSKHICYVIPKTVFPGIAAILGLISSSNLIF